MFSRQLLSKSLYCNKRSIIYFDLYHKQILCCKIESLPGVIRKCPRTLSAQLFSRLYQSMCEGDLHAKLFLSAKTRIENVGYKTCMGFTGGKDLLERESLSIFQSYRCSLSNNS